jgi:hypothetical protein
MEGNNKIKIHMETKFELFRKEQYELILEAGLGELFDHDRISFPAIKWHGLEQFITEIRLAQQDIFICNKWGLFLLNTAGKEDVKFEEHTYPDRNYFDKQSASEAEIFYNANLSFIVNNAIVVPELRTDKFRMYRSVEERRGYGLSGLVEIQGGYLLLEGSKNVYFNLQLPRKTCWKYSSIRLRLRLRGILFRNATIIT